MKLGKEWEKLITEIIDLQRVLGLFKVDFIDSNYFKDFCDNKLPHDLSNFENYCITGYFSETIRETLERIVRRRKNDKHGKVRLICPEFPLNTKRDRRNFEVLEKLVEEGAEVKINNRLHARMFVGYNPSREWAPEHGKLILGSFDFNTECIGKERYDAGIITSHPDLVKSAIDFFERIWKKSGSKNLNEVNK